MSHSKFVTALVIAGTMFAGAAFAGDVKSTFGNTLVMSYADGTKVEFRNAADGTSKVTTADGKQAGAKWVVAGDKITYTADADGKTYTYDMAGPAMEVGKKVPGKDYQGKDVTYELVAGQ